ncbi:ABC transporter substrate-binding protein [Halodesulfovibrio spirochaetisodalis]|uniref:Cytochrome C n=1 Tax=Halodesulfovibrio spirochaetisodalis TaxID=1560234 RepID=A0A1B7XH97_9BACT|nr:ABC transporter substrate-binding protein [Halodesulfovibrio spirochaetisodalis]OBQ54861.1 cytochrome C [Halodesulfovibrio spirochaetisodalis]
MKRLLTVLALAAVLAFAAAPASAKTLRLAVDADPVSLDPHVQLSGGMLQYSHLVFDPLVRWNQDMGFDPRLATSWERIDDKTMRFHLRKGVKFHSGNEFTAKDVAWTLDRLKKSIDYKGLYEVFEPAVVVDDYTVDLKTKVPYPLLINMATYLFPMDSKFYSGKDENGEPKDKIGKTSPSFANTHASGTGPFTVAEREQGVKMVFKANPNYWTDRGNIEEIDMRPIKNEATRVASILSSDVDFIMPVPPQDYDRLDAADNVDLITMPGTRVIMFQLNQERNKAFKNPKVREAIVYATNNPGIVKKILKGRGTAAAQQSPKGYQGHDANLKPRYDLKKAKALMKEAGYADGFEATMIAPNNRYVKDEQIAQAFVSMMARIGIKVNLKTMPKAQYWDQFDARAADIQMIGWHSDTEDSANFTEYLAVCPNKDTGAGQYNSGEYCNPEVDKLVALANSETDTAKRKAQLQKIEQILNAEAAFVPLHWQDLSWAGGKNLENAREIVNVMNYPYFGDLVMK